MASGMMLERDGVERLHRRDRCPHPGLRSDPVRGSLRLGTHPARFVLGGHSMPSANGLGELCKHVASRFFSEGVIEDLDSFCILLR